MNARDTRAVAFEETRSEAASTQPAEVLRFENVSIRFDDKPALGGVSLQVNAGETAVLCGAARSPWSGAAFDTALFKGARQAKNGDPLTPPREW